MKFAPLKSLPVLLVVLGITAVAYHMVSYFSGGDLVIYTRGLVISEIIAVSSFLSQQRMGYKQAIPIAILTGAFTALLNIHFIPPPQS